MQATHVNFIESNQNKEIRSTGEVKDLFVINETEEEPELEEINEEFITPVASPMKKSESSQKHESWAKKMEDDDDEAETDKEETDSSLE